MCFIRVDLCCFSTFSKNGVAGIAVSDFFANFAVAYGTAAWFWREGCFIRALSPCLVKAATGAYAGCVMGNLLPATGVAPGWESVAGCVPKKRRQLIFSNTQFLKAK